MAVGLETRVPFLDHRVIELAWQLPMRMKIRGGQGKWALRQLLQQHVPVDLVSRPKQGFSIPLADWLRGPLRDWAEALISPTGLEQAGYLHGATVMKKWQEHQSGKTDWHNALWSVLMFQAWLQESGAP
jgi:asparagine synthase (glutamine-hydrolysing)